MSIVFQGENGSLYSTAIVAGDTGSDTGYHADILRAEPDARRSRSHVPESKRHSGTDTKTNRTVPP